MTARKIVYSSYGIDDMVLELLREDRRKNSAQYTGYMDGLRPGAIALALGFPYSHARVIGAALARLQRSGLVNVDTRSRSWRWSAP